MRDHYRGTARADSCNGAGSVGSEKFGAKRLLRRLGIPGVAVSSPPRTLVNLKNPPMELAQWANSLAATPSGELKQNQDYPNITLTARTQAIAGSAPGNDNMAGRGRRSLIPTALWYSAACNTFT